MPAFTPYQFSTLQDLTADAFAATDRFLIQHLNGGTSGPDKFYTTELSAVTTYLKTYNDTLYQPLNPKLTAIGGLANTAGLLNNNGSGTFSYQTLGTGVATALAVNIHSSGSFLVQGSDLSTPSAGDLVNCTGLPAAGVVGTAAVLGANTFVNTQTITQANTNASILVSTGYSLTGNDYSSMIDLTGHWNTGGSPTAILLKMYDTASNPNSLLMDLQCNNASRFSVCKDGTVAIGNIIFYPAFSSPGSNPPSGYFYMYVDNFDSKIKLRGPSGTVTIFANP